MPEQIRLDPTGRSETIEGRVGAVAAPAAGGRGAAGAVARLVRVDVSRLAVAAVQRERFRLTAEALRRCDVRGIAADEVWEVLRTAHRQARYLSADAVVIFGMTGAGRCLALLAKPSVTAVGGWDVIAGRDLDADELGVFAFSTRARAGAIAGVTPGSA
jgi:hypothetical protein